MGFNPWKGSCVPDTPRFLGMAGVRDRLIHDYLGVNLDIVWDIVTVDLPEVASRIAEIIRED
ncbi:MAG: HepT-like ribonuclease domain-containing protein [Thermodesulfobacteriota bacterium]